jgi:hypothetical protein
MDGVDRGFPPGHIRVSDADRERAVAELSEAFQIGRITVSEFDERSGQALRARTGKELTALLADLPTAADLATADLATAADLAAAAGRPTGAGLAPRTAAALAEPAYRAPTPGIAIGTSVAAACFATVAVAGAMGVGSGPTMQQQETIRAMMARQGFPVPPLTPSIGVNWAGVTGAAAVAVLFIVLTIIIVGVARARQS